MASRVEVVYATGYLGQICTSCDELKPMEEFYREAGRATGHRSACKACVNADHKRYKTPEKKERIHRRSIRDRFGLPDGEYDRLLASQGGVCKICRQTNPNGNRLSVDHDHISGRVRGLLCTSCNVGVGHFRDDPTLLRAAANYVSLA